MDSVNFKKAAEAWDTFSLKDEPSQQEYLSSHWLHTNGTISSKYRWVRALEGIFLLKFLHRLICRINQEQDRKYLTDDMKETYAIKSIVDVTGALEDIENVVGTDDQVKACARSIEILKTALLFAAYSKYIYRKSVNDVNRHDVNRDYNDLVTSLQTALTAFAFAHAGYRVRSAI